MANDTVYGVPQVITDEEEIKRVNALLDAPTAAETTKPGGMSSDAADIYTQPDKTVGPMERIRLQSEATTGVQTTIPRALGRLAGDLLFLGDTRKIEQKNALSDILKGEWTMPDYSKVGATPMGTPGGLPVNPPKKKVTFATARPEEITGMAEYAGLDPKAVQSLYDQTTAYYQKKGEAFDPKTVMQDTVQTLADDEMANRVHVSARASRALPGKDKPNKEGLGYSVIGGGLQNLPYMGQFAIGSAAGGVGIVLPLLASYDRRFNENRTSEYRLAPEGGVREFKAGMTDEEAVAPSLRGAVGEVGIEMLGGKAVGFLGKKILGPVVAKLGGDKVMRDSPFVRGFVKSFNDLAKITKTQSYPEEIAEEWQQEMFDAAFLTNPEYRDKGDIWQRLGKANENFGGNFGEIALSMLLMQGGQAAIAAAKGGGEVATEKRVEGEAGARLKAAGVDDATVKNLLADRDARSVIEYISAMTPEDAQAAAKRMSARSVQAAEEVKKTTEWMDALGDKGAVSRFTPPSPADLVPGEDGVSRYGDTATGIEITHDTTNGEVGVFNRNTGRQSFVFGGKTLGERMERAFAIADAMDKESQGRDIVNAKKEEMLANVLKAKGVEGEYVIVRSREELAAQPLSKNARANVAAQEEIGNIPQAFVDAGDNEGDTPVTYFVLDAIRLGSGPGAIGQTMRNIVDAATHEPVHMAALSPKAAAAFRSIYDKVEPSLRLEVIRHGIERELGPDAVAAEIAANSASADDTANMADAKERALRRWFEEGFTYLNEGAVTPQASGAQRLRRKVRDFFKADIKSLEDIGVLVERGMEAAKGAVKVSGPREVRVVAGQGEDTISEAAKTASAVSDNASEQTGAMPIAPGADGAGAAGEIDRPTQATPSETLIPLTDEQAIEAMAEPQAEPPPVEEAVAPRPESLPTPPEGKPAVVEQKAVDAAPFEVEGATFDGILREEGEPDKAAWTLKDEDTALRGSFVMPADATKEQVEARIVAERAKFAEGKKAAADRKGRSPERVAALKRVAKLTREGSAKEGVLPAPVKQSPPAREQETQTLQTSTPSSDVSGRGASISPKAPELMAPEEYIEQALRKARIAPDETGDMAERDRAVVTGNAEESHANLLADMAEQHKPLNARAVDMYFPKLSTDGTYKDNRGFEREWTGYRIPQGYVREGDLYVWKPEGTPPGGGKKPAPSPASPFTPGQKVSTARNADGVAYSGEVVKADKDTVTIRARGERPKGKLFRAYGVTKDGKVITKDVGVPASLVQATGATAAPAPLSGIQKRQAARIAAAQDAMMNAELAAGEAAAPADAVDRVLGAEAGRERRRTDNETMFRVIPVENKELLSRLESGKKIKAFRAMQLIDGKLYPPMSAKVEGKMREPSQIGRWEQAVEQPELIRNGKFVLDKANKTVVPARYNPYFHTSRSPLNDQFSSAYKRPNLVVVEVEVPESELTSGYKATGAKDSVGELSWHSGPVSSKLPKEKTRKVILTRYVKPIRVVPDSEVAERVAYLLEGENIEIPENVITPSLKSELVKRGVRVQGEDNETMFRVQSEKEQTDGQRLAGNVRGIAEGGRGRDKGDDARGNADSPLRSKETLVLVPGVSPDKRVEQIAPGVQKTVGETMFRVQQADEQLQQTEGTENEQRNVAERYGLPKIALPDSIQREMQGSHRERLAEDLRGVHRQFQKDMGADQGREGVNFRVTPEQDSAYADAVNRGDMETAGRMLYARAASKGALTSDDGSPLILHHGSRAKTIRLFDDERLGSNTGAASATRGHFLVDDARVAFTYMDSENEAADWMRSSISGHPVETAEANLARANDMNAAAVYDPETDKEFPWQASIETYDEWGSPHNYIVGFFDNEAEAEEAATLDKEQEIEKAQRWLDEANTRWKAKVDSYNAERSITKAFVFAQNPYYIDFRGAGYREKSFSAAIDEAVEEDADVVVFQDVKDAADGSELVADVYIVLKGNASKIKSADIATYDDQGNLIPLSRRFDDSTTDIRFRVDRGEQNETLKGILADAAEQRKEAEADGDDFDADRFIYNVRDGDLEEAFPVIASDFYGDPTTTRAVVYHRTPGENAEAIASEGLNARDKSRGIGNRWIGNAIFAAAEDDPMMSYGDVLVEIDLNAARNLSAIETELEPSVAESIRRSALASLLGVEDIGQYEVSSSYGETPDTLVIKGNIDRRAIRVTDKDGNVIHTGDAFGKRNPNINFRVDRGEAVDAFLEMRYEYGVQRLTEFERTNGEGEGGWRYPSFARVKKIWEDYAAMGFVRDERGMDDIAHSVVYNIAAMDFETQMSGHSTNGFGSSETLEEFEMEPWDDDKLERYYDWTGLHISDYAMDPLKKLAVEILQAETAEEKLVLVDRVFNTVHMASDLLAENFIEGGSKSLNQLSGTGEHGTAYDIRFRVSRDPGQLDAARKTFAELSGLMDNDPTAFRRPQGAPDTPIDRPVVFDKAELDRIGRAITGENLPTLASVSNESAMLAAKHAYKDYEMRVIVDRILDENRPVVNDETVGKLSIYLQSLENALAQADIEYEKAVRENDTARQLMIIDDHKAMVRDLGRAAQAKKNVGSVRAQALSFLKTGLDSALSVVYRVTKLQEATGRMVTREEYNKIVARVEADAKMMKALNESHEKALLEEDAKLNKAVSAERAKAEKLALDAYRKGAKDERADFDFLAAYEAAKKSRLLDPSASFDGIDIGGVAFRVSGERKEAGYPGALRDLARETFASVKSQGRGIVAFERRMFEEGVKRGFAADLIDAYVYDFGKRLGIPVLEKAPAKLVYVKPDADPRQIKNPEARRKAEVKAAVRQAVSEDMEAPGDRIAARAVEILDNTEWAYLSPADVMGIVTGYPAELETDTREELEKRLSMIRRQMLAFQRIAQMARGEYPTRMSLGNDAPDVTLRQLAREVRDMMNSFEFPAGQTDPRLVNAQQALANRLKYAVEELQKAVDAGTPINEKAPRAVPETPEIKALRSTLKELRAAYEALPAVEEIKAARDTELARRAANKRYHFWNKRLEDAKTGVFPPIFKGTSADERDAETAAYKAKAEEARREYWRIKKESPQEKVAALSARVAKAEDKLANLEAALAATPVADPRAPRTPEAPPATPEEAALRERLAAVRLAVANVRRNILAKWRDENAEEIERVREADRYQFLVEKAAVIERKIKAGDFTKPAKRPRVWSPRIAIEEDKVRAGLRVINERILWEANAAAGWTGKAKNANVWSGNVYRFFKASMDWSNVGVQSARLFTASPVFGTKLIGGTMAHAGSDESQAEFMADMHNDIDYGKGYEDGVALDQQYDDVFGTGMGESFFRGLAMKYQDAGFLGRAASVTANLALVSQRGFDMYGRMMRFHAYKAIVNDPAHANMTKAERRAVANMVNIMGGVGNTRVYPHDVASVLSNLMWSSRLFTAQWQTLAGGGGLIWNAGMGPEGSRKALGREWWQTAAPGALKLYARSLAGNVALAWVFGGIGMMFGDRQPWEDDETMFWKAWDFLFGRRVIGSKNIDVSGGLTSYVALIRRVVDGSHVSMSGRTVPDNDWRAWSAAVSNFARGRLRPDLSFALNMVFGEDVTGEAFGPRGGVKGVVNAVIEGGLPITPLQMGETAHDLWQTHGVLGVTAGLIPALASDLFGFSKSTAPRDPRYEINRHKSHMGQVKKAYDAAKDTGNAEDYKRLADTYAFDIVVARSVSKLGEAANKAKKIAENKKYPADYREKAAKAELDYLERARDILRQGK